FLFTFAALLLPLRGDIHSITFAAPLFSKNVDKPSEEVRFRRSQVGLRRAETPLQNFETAFLFGRLKQVLINRKL
ncbi:MAG: hypothetical protein J6H19_01840, partial [Bacteroidaceae bacterium]|nr:hypothetical protein [Bacteroidaceae bacterium]